MGHCESKKVDDKVDESLINHEKLDGSIWSLESLLGMMEDMKNGKDIL